VFEYDDADEPDYFTREEVEQHVTEAAKQAAEVYRVALRVAALCNAPASVVLKALSGSAAAPEKPAALPQVVAKAEPVADDEPAALPDENGEDHTPAELLAAAVEVVRRAREDGTDPQDALDALHALGMGGRFEKAASPKWATGVIESLVNAQESGDDLSGLRVWGCEDGPQFWIDQLDWHDGKAGKKVIAAAQKAAGVREVIDHKEPPESGPAVAVFNEGANPEKASPKVWVDLTDFVPRLKALSGPPVAAVDLDGTISHYDGWKGDEHFGAPLEGAKEFLADLRGTHRVVIYTTRTKADDVRLDRGWRGAHDLAELVANWLDKNGLLYDEIYTGQGKPLADVYVDDRAVPVPENPSEPDYRRALRLIRERTFKKAWDSNKHPRDDGGRFIKVADIKAAKKDPEKAAELRKKVTNPEERKKLDHALHSDELSGSTRDVERHASQVRREQVQANRTLARKLRIKLADQESRGEALDPDDLRALIPHLSTMTQDELSTTRVMLERSGASFGGKRLRADRVAALTQWALDTAAGKTDEPAPEKPEAESGSAAAQGKPPKTRLQAQAERARAANPPPDPNQEFATPREQYQAFLRYAHPDDDAKKPDAGAVAEYLSKLPDGAREKLDAHFASAGKSLAQVESFHRARMAEATPERVPPATGEQPAAVPQVATGSAAAPTPPDVSALKRNPKADAEHLNALAARTSDPAVKDAIESAAWNLDGVTGDETARRRATLEQLAASHRALHDGGNAAGAEAVADVVRQYGGKLHGPAVGQPAAGDGRYYEMPAGTFTGDNLTVKRQPVVHTDARGREFVASKGELASGSAAATGVDTGTAGGNTTPTQGGSAMNGNAGGGEPPKVPPVASGAGDGAESEPHIVNGDTFQHKDAIRAAGGKWDADGKFWTVPAGTSLPAGLSTQPISKTRVGRERRYSGLIDRTRLTNPGEGGMSRNAPYEIASVMLSGPVTEEQARAQKDTAVRLNTRSIKTALARAQQGGLPIGAVADDLVAAGFDRAAVAADLNRRIAVVAGDSELNAAGKAAVQAEITKWLAGNANVNQTSGAEPPKVPAVASGAGDEAPKGKPIAGAVKWAQNGKLVAEIPQREAAFLNHGRSVITVGGVTGRVIGFGNPFKGKQYVYLEHHHGELPPKPKPADDSPADGGQTELRNAIM